MGNQSKYYIQSAFYNIVVMLLSGAVLQTFLAESGVSEESIAFLVSVMQVVQTAVILLGSSVADKTKNIIRASALVHLLDIPFAFCLLWGCFSGTMASSLAYGLLLACGIMMQVGFGLTNIFSYKLPYHIIPMTEYGKLTAYAGVVSGVVTLLLSLFMSFLQSKWSYFLVMGILFSVAVLSAILYMQVTLSMKEIKAPAIEQTEKKKISILKYRPFTKFILPNLCRGFCSGIVLMAVTIGYYCNILDSQSAGVLVVITNTVAIVSCLAYPVLARKIGEGWMLLISGVVMVLTMPLMLVGGSAMLFLIFYTVTYFFFNIIAMAVPVAVTKFVDYEVIGQYSGLRMMLHTGGTAAAGFVCIFLLKTMGGVATMLVSALLQLFSSVVYFRHLKSHKF